ncbi:MAG: type II secretion system F family protein [bacterium]|nr:type II secretion system F family protein [bacterium]
MPTEFEYKAYDLTGAAVLGSARMETSEAVRDLLAERNLIPISIKPKTKTTWDKIIGNLRSRSTREDLILFTRKLNALYKAGVPITNSLGVIAEQDANKYFSAVAGRLRNDLEQGYSFSEAIAQHLDVFPDTYIHAIRVAEETGRLDVVMEKLATTLERDLETREQIKTAVRYPVIVVILVIAAFFALVTFVVPKFAEFYTKNNAQLPLPTQILIDLNVMIRHYWPLLVALIVIGIPVGIRLFRLKQVREKFDGLILKLPIFGPLFNKIYIARFSHLLEVTFTSGAPLLKGLDTIRSAIGNRVIEAEIDKIRQQVQQGNSLGSIRNQLPHFPSLALSLIQIGLESGSLDFMLQQVASFYDREVDYTTKRLMTLIEPLLILFLGCVVLVMALAIFLPMWNLVEVFRPH